jgi:hypothetical protein
MRLAAFLLATLACTTVATAKGHAAIDALLAAWADDAPLAKKLAGAASTNSCA